MAAKADNRRHKRLAAEEGAIIKSWHGRVRVALVYPNHYPVGMANLGFQTVYKLLNHIEHVVCERVFLPDPDEAAAAVASLESARPLQDFDCLAFSLSFESDYVNVLSILQKAGLPLPAVQRGGALPLLMAGGVSCFLNPEPIAPFFDCFLLGEAEELVPAFFDRFDPEADRTGFLLQIARDLPGVYVPSLYRDSYTADGILQAFTPLADVPARVRRVQAPDIACFATDTTIVSPETGFEDACLIEVSRGCPHGCRFCAAGYVYRPPRFRPLSLLEQSLAKAAGRSRKVGLLGAAVSDLPDLASLCSLGEHLGVQLSFSSLRADALDSALVAALRQGRLNTATIAPETGSERMRRVINKGLSEAQVLAAVEKLVTGGIPNLKLYFMVGLPTETGEDIHAIVTLIEKIKAVFLDSSRSRRHMGRITVSLGSFVPKPFTPFQWEGMDTVAVLRQKIEQVRRGVKSLPNVRVQADAPRRALVQAVMARGDRRVSALLTRALRKDGNWPQVFKQASVGPGFYAHRTRRRDELLPWDFIDHGLHKSFLWREYQRALQSRSGTVCPIDPGRCRVCGVCGRDDGPAKAS